MLPPWVMKAGIVAAALVGLVFLIDRMHGQLLSPENVPRLLLWNLFPALFLERPFLGYGLGATATALIPHLRSVKEYASLGIQPGSDFHDSYLTALTDLGAIGAALLGWLLAGIVRGLSKSEPALSSLVVASLASGFFESWFFGIGEGFALVFWLSAIFVATGIQARGNALGSASPVVEPAPG